MCRPTALNTVIAVVFLVRVAGKLLNHTIKAPTSTTAVVRYPMPFGLPSIVARVAGMFKRYNH